MGSIRLKGWKITLSRTLGATWNCPPAWGTKYFFFQSGGMVSGSSYTPFLAAVMARLEMSVASSRVSHWDACAPR